MKTMQALVFQEAKNFDSFVIKAVPRPVPGPGEVLVQVKASALNRRDFFITQGLYANIKTPIILGSDGAGVVADVGDGVDRSWLDKAVIINSCLDWGDNSRAQQRDFRILGMPDDGTQAEYVRVPATNIMLMPAHFSFEEAAAIPLAGLTGYRALFTQGQLSAEDTVLITGAGGGVAALMLQMACAINATVLVTSGNDEKIARAVAAGAKGGANYHDPEWPKQITTLAGDKGVSLIVDSAGGEGFDALTSIVNPGGRMVFFGATLGNPPQFNQRRVYWKQLTIQGTTMGSPADFEQMVHFFESYEIKPFIDGPYPITQYREAYLRMKEGKQFGKIVLTPAW